MLQYLLNLSAIWLLSLIVFDVFLRRDTYHSYNRLYLFMTLILGICLPLWSWQGDAAVYSNNLSRPVIEKAFLLKQSVVESGAVQTTFSWQQYIFIIYLLGAFISLLILLKDAILIIRLYNKGDKTKDGVWTIIETGKEHTPFSAFRYVFISNKENYSSDELRMILSHEEQHGHLLHFADLVFLQLAKIAFWFHPLVYIYANRLITVHEYQADAAVDKTPATYGQFLVEQAILQSAPALTHAFNHSPIKKRILMLTRKTSALAKSKQLVSIPLVLLCILCFTKDAFSNDKREKNGNLITYRGNVFNIHPYPTDTSTVYESVTGKPTMMLTVIDGMMVESMNSKKVYHWRDFEGKSPYTTAGYTDKGLREYLLANLKDEVKQLKDGEYYILMDCIVVDENGEIAYYNYGGITSNYDDVFNAASKGVMNVQDKFAKKITTLMHDAPKHSAATIDGKAVPMQISNQDFENPFVVKGGKITAILVNK